MLVTTPFGIDSGWPWIDWPAPPDSTIAKEGTVPMRASTGTAISANRQKTAPPGRRTVAAAQADRQHNGDRGGDDLEQSAAGKRVWDRVKVVARTEHCHQDEHEQVTTQDPPCRSQFREKGTHLPVPCGSRYPGKRTLHVMKGRVPGLAAGVWRTVGR